MEVLEVAGDPAFAADYAGLNYGDLDADDRLQLDAAQRHALIRGLRRVEEGALEGDIVARAWLRRLGVTLPKTKRSSRAAASRGRR